MKNLLRSVLIYAFSLYALTYILPGVKISGGIATYLFGGVALTLIKLIIKPILEIISFPFNLITLGIFSIFTNMLILYLLTVFVPSVQIQAFTYPGFSFAGVVLPKVYLSLFFAFLVATLLLSLIDSGLSWIMK
jgi:putative membrane protein